MVVRDEGVGGAPGDDGATLASGFAGANFPLGERVAGGELPNAVGVWAGFLASSSCFFFRLRNDNYLMQLLNSAK